MKRGDRVKVPGHVLTVQDGIATVEFNGTYPGNGQRIRIAVEAIDPEDVTDTEAAERDLAGRPARMTPADLDDRTARFLKEHPLPPPSKKYRNCWGDR